MSDSDEDLALAFLAGRITQKPDGTISHTFLPSGSAAEREAQAALVRVLRNGLPLSPILRQRLAALLDQAHTAEARQLVVKNRAGGVQPNHVIDVEIARDLAAIESEGGKIDAEVAAAAKRYRVSESTVWRAWQEHGDVWRNALLRRTVN